MYQITLFASFGGISYVCYSKQHVFCFFFGWLSYATGNNVPFPMGKYIN